MGPMSCPSVPIDKRLTSPRRPTQFVDCQINIATPEAVDEGVDPLGRSGAKAISKTFAIDDRSRTHRFQPARVRPSGDAYYRRPQVACELNRDRSNTARGSRDGHNLAGFQPNGLNGCPRCSAGHIQGGGRLPGHTRRFGHYLIGRQPDRLCVTRPLVTPTDYLVPDGNLVHPIAQLGYHTGQIATFPGRKGGRKTVAERSISDSGFAQVDGGGDHVHHHPAGCSKRTGDLDHVEDVSIPIVIKANRLHRQIGHGSNNSHPNSKIPRQLITHRPPGDPLLVTLPSSSQTHIVNRYRAWSADQPRELSWEARYDAPRSAERAWC